MDKTFFWDKFTLVNFFLLIIPLLIGLQPFFPTLVQELLIYGRLIIIPCLLVYKLHSEFNFAFFLLFFIYPLSLTIFSPPINFNDFLIIFFSMFSSITFFKLGHYFANRNKDNSFFLYLIYGVNVINIITIIIFYLLDAGFMNVDTFFSLTQKEVSYGVYRFSIGNPIELPFTITCLLYAAIILVGNNRAFLFSVTLNLFVVFISQSRVVVLIALLLFILELIKSGFKKKIIIGILILLSLIYLKDELFLISESFFNRVSGDDYGSKDDRIFLLNLVIQNINFATIFSGHGLTSSTILMKEVTGVYRTIESVFLQLLYEFGIMGSGLFLATLYFKKKVLTIPRGNKIMIFFISLQLFFFLSVYTLMPFSFFLLGVCSKTIFKKTAATFNNTKEITS